MVFHYFYDMFSGYYIFMARYWYYYFVFWLWGLLVLLLHGQSVNINNYRRTGIDCYLPYERKERFQLQK